MTAIKDAFEDWKRHSQDRTLNKSRTTRLSNWRNVNVPEGDVKRFKFLRDVLNGLFGSRKNSNQIGQETNSNDNNNYTKQTEGSSLPTMQSFQSAKWTDSRWQDVRVGDIIQLRNNDPVPADMIILSTSEPDGLCYVETKNLDGETNLKIRHSNNATSSLLTESDCEQASFYVKSEPAHANLYSYNGTLHWIGANNNGDVNHPNEKVEPLSINDVLLRGCILRNTEWVIGLVIFTGTDTKIMLNSGDTPSKRSRIEIETNFHVTMNFVILFLLCLGSGIAQTVYFIQPRSSADVFGYEGDISGGALFSGFLTFWTSLVLFQNIVPISLYITIEMVKTAYFIHSDVEMYYEKLDYPCVPKTWNISDDLGQIEYIFSDKTGTLTQNVMEFRKCTINGVAYGLGETDAMRAEKKLMLEEMSNLFENKYISQNLTFIDSELYQDLKVMDQQSKAIQDFFSVLALCHTVLVEHPNENDPYTIDYKAQSPDEAALVGCARDIGFVFLERYQDTLAIEVMGQRKEFTLLNVLEFNSTRKRMSAILRLPEGGIVLLCKGADSVVYERLRTLCIAYRTISEEEYNVWSAKYAEAASSINNREEKIEEVCELIEHSLILMGGTAIEDRLQEGVPETIATLAQAGIKLWVLTGDKVETAINIGFSCNLLQKDMLLIIINASDKQSTLSQINEAIKKFFECEGEKKNKHALIIDGETLKYGLDNDIKPYLLDLGKRCESVVCCRVSPLQKAQVVAMVKEGLNVMTLSIGDGANDVSMIQEANVGVGIAGEEGRQAAMSADFAVAQFRYLEKLLLVHGRWSYIRISEMISCFFYKNIVWTIAMFWYQIWAGFSAQYLYDYTYIMLYNLIFTAIPVMYLGAFDQDVDSKTSLKNPQLYKRGILQQDFTKSKFWLYVMDAVYQSLICFFVPYGLLQFGQSHRTGLTNNSLDDLGTVVAGSVVVTTNLYVGINTLNWSWIGFLVIAGSILSFYLWAELYSIVYSIGFFRVDIILFSDIDFWLTIIFVTMFSIMPRYVVKYLHKSYWPTDTDIIREQVYQAKKHKKIRKRMIVDEEEDRLPINTKPGGYAASSSASYMSNNTYEDAYTSVRSIEQLIHMDSGKRQSFTGFAFSVEESGFESFRESVYKPIQNISNKLRRSRTISTTTDSSIKESKSITTASSNNLLHSTQTLINRSKTLPSTLFSRLSSSSSISRSPSPNSLNFNNEEVELSLYGIWETYKYITDAILKFSSRSFNNNVCYIFYPDNPFIYFINDSEHGKSKTKFLKVFKALAYTIAAFYSFVAMIPFIVLAAKKDEFTSSCFKSGYSGDCRTLINTMIVGSIINVIVLAVFSLYFAAIVKAYVLKMNTERRNSQRETTEETPKETNMETSSQPVN
ncbi:13954_t:CDS:10 [Entrophospora sp. SA101]|nr:13954_t:CDS:10 [Entrophospora sp. SA101]